jgi:hypothetical protein
VKALVDDIAMEIPRIRRLIDSKKLGLGDFDYVKYNGAEIIP